MRSAESAEAVARLAASVRRQVKPPSESLDGDPPTDALIELDPIASRHRWGSPTMTRGTITSVFLLAFIVALGLGFWSWRQHSQRSQSIVTQRVTSDDADGAAQVSARVPITSQAREARVTASSTTPPPTVVQRAAVVVVHVVGRVRHPGLVTLSSGARVSDALAAAGGPTRDAMLARINLARHLQDGEQVVIPDADDPVSPSMGSPGGSSGSSAAAPNGDAKSGLVDLNTATAAELDALPGVGPVMAQRILDWRAQHQRFTRVEELTEIKGIGPAMLTRLRPLVTV